MLTDDERYRRAQQGRATSEKRRGTGEFYGGHYREPKRGPFYCVLCDLEFRDAEGLVGHRELRHEEPRA